MTLSIMTLSIMTLSIMTLSIMTFSITIINHDTQHTGSRNIMLLCGMSFMLSVASKPFMISVIMMNVVVPINLSIHPYRPPHSPSDFN
jgi:hypothetical protein